VKTFQVMAGVAAVSLTLSGCALFKSPTPLDTYELSAPSGAAKQMRKRMQILIAEPPALKSLDGQNIVIRRPSGVIEFLKGAQWSDRLPRIVQARLAETFQRSGAFAGVGLPGEGLAIDYQVIAELRTFEVHVDGDRNAHIELFVRLLNDRNGEVRASRDFKASSPVSGSGNDAYAQALNRAFETIASEIVEWTDSVI
jgi:cholesterol transport system auxiliary component